MCQGLCASKSIPTPAKFRQRHNVDNNDTEGEGEIECDIDEQSASQTNNIIDGMI